jgi:tetratricopeptide (TPR) repeat protein
VLLATERNDEAEALFRRAVERFEGTEDGPDLVFHLGMSCVLNGRRLEGSQWFEKAIAAAPAHALYQFSWAENERNLQRLERAEQGFRAAMRLSPGHPDARWKLAVTLAHAGRAAEAEPLFKEALASGPSKSRESAGFEYGVFLFGQGRHEEALVRLESATRAQPDDRMAWSYLARALRALGQGERAEAAVARYRELQATADRKDTEYLLGLIRDRLTRPEDGTAPGDKKDEGAGR